MKKQIKIIIIALFISMIGTLNANAASLKFGDLSPIAQGSSGKLTIELVKTAEEDISKIDFTISISETGAGSFALSKSSYIGGSINTYTATLAHEPTINSGEIAILDISNMKEHSVNKNIELKISNIKINDEKIDDVTKNITFLAVSTTTPKAKSNNAALSSLSFSAGTLSPKFDGSNTKYKVFGIRDTIKTITVIPNCDNCTFVIKCELGCTNYGNQQRPNLEIGKNIIKISTVSESGNNNLDYFITVYRGETTDNSSMLESVKIDGFKLNEKFDKTNLDYTLSVPYDLEDLVLTAVPEDSTAKVDIKGNTGLLVGENVITITVTSSETEDKTIYNIVVTRLEEGEIVVTTKPIVNNTNKTRNKTITLIVLIITGLLIIGTSAYFIFFHKKIKAGKKLELKKDELKKNKLNDDNISQSENELIDELNVTDVKMKPSIDEALSDVMQTKELILKDTDF